MILLDTSALLIWTLKSKTLPPAAQQAISQSEKLIVSSISLWEIGWKEKMGKLRLKLPFKIFLSELRQVEQVEIVPVDLKTWVKVVEIDWAHRDPADRVIVASALLLNCPIVTSDQAMRAYYDQCIW